MRLSSFWQEFKAFAFKGNMIDLAVAVVIGTAFGAVINSLVKDVIMPAVTYVTEGAVTAAHTAATVAEKTGQAVRLTSQPGQTQPATTQAIQITNPPSSAPAVAATPNQTTAQTSQTTTQSDNHAVDITWKIGRIQIGNFVGSLLNFLLIALAVFLVIVKLLGSVVKRVGGTPDPSEPTTRECPFCLSVIPIKAVKCAHCTADLPASPPAVGASPLAK